MGKERKRQWPLSKMFDPKVISRTTGLGSCKCDRVKQRCAVKSILRPCPSDFARKRSSATESKPKTLRPKKNQFVLRLSAAIQAPPQSKNQNNSIPTLDPLHFSTARLRTKTLRRWQFFYTSTIDHKGAMKCKLTTTHIDKLRLLAPHELSCGGVSTQR